MKIAILASEGAPYAKSGGLGDVMEALPAALSRIPGNEVVLILPYYKKILDNPAYEVERVHFYDTKLAPEFPRFFYLNLCKIQLHRHLAVCQIHIGLTVKQPVKINFYIFTGSGKSHNTFSVIAEL